MVFTIVYFSIIPVIAAFVIALNCIFVITLLKIRSLQTSSNAVLGCLCSSDLLIGVFTFPVWGLHISLIYSQPSHEGIKLLIAFGIVRLGFTGLSSLFIMLVNLDRYVAICHPYKYIKYATSKLYVIIFICTCLIYAVTTTLSFILYERYGTLCRNVNFAIIFIATMAVLIYCNWKILRVIGRHRREIASVERNSYGHGQQSGFHGETKRYRIIIIVVILFAICKLPQILSYLLIFIVRLRVTFPLFIFYHVSDILLLVNGLLNPLVFCFSVKCFRTAVKSLFCCQRAIQ